MGVRDGERRGWYAAPARPSSRSVVIVHEIAGLGAGRAWLTGDRMSVGYDGSAAEDAWQRFFAFFDRHLK